MLFTQAATNVITSIVVSKYYPQYEARGNLDQNMRHRINKRIRDLFTAKIGTVIVNSADTIVISAFLGLTILAIYQNYYFILYSLISVVAIVFQSCTAGVGNSIIVETKEKNYNDLKVFTFLIMWISGMCSACLLCLYQPFMEIWVGKELKLDFSAVICFVIYYFIYEINQLLNMYKDAAGIWHKDRFRPLVTAGTNLILNLILVNFWGIYGVLLSTVLSMLFVGMPWLLNNLFTELFEKRHLKNYVMNLFTYLLATGFICVFCYCICRMISLPLILQLILNFFVCLIGCNLLFFLFFHKKPEFIETIVLIDKMTKNKLHLTALFSKK